MGVVPIAEGFWTTDDVWDRLVEAIEVHRLLPHVGFPSLMGNVWPHIVRDSFDAYGYGETPVRERAEPSQIDRCIETLGWLRWVRMEERKAILWLARGAPPKWIARRLRCHRNSVRNFRLAGLARIAAILNRRGDGR